MHTHIRAAAAAGLAALIFFPLSAGASTIIYGKSFAHDCSLRALHGEHDAATLVICTQALEQDIMSEEDYAKTLVNRGVVSMRRTNFNDASMDFDKAQKITPGLPEIYVNRAVVLIKHHQFKEAVSQLDRGIELGTDEAEKAYYDRALAKEALGDVKGAYYDYKKASDLKPEWELPKNELIRFNVTHSPT
jgi:tetratricopeptide (TPR) repeat protein